MDKNENNIEVNDTTSQQNNESSNFGDTSGGNKMMMMMTNNRMIQPNQNTMINSNRNSEILEQQDLPSSSSFSSESERIQRLEQMVNLLQHQVKILNKRLKVLEGRSGMPDSLFEMNSFPQPPSTSTSVKFNNLDAINTISGQSNIHPILVEQFPEIESRVYPQQQQQEQEQEQEQDDEEIESPLIKPLSYGKSLPKPPPIIRQQKNSLGLELKSREEEEEEEEDSFVLVEEEEVLESNTNNTNTNIIGFPRNNGHYYIVNECGTVLDNKGETKDGKLLQAFGFVPNSPNQGFKFIQISEKFWSIVNIKSGKAVDMTGRSENNQPFQSWEFNRNNKNQWFELKSHQNYGKDKFYIVCGNGSKVMDLYKGSNNNGNKIVQNECNRLGSRNQIWRLVEYPRGVCLNAGSFFVINKTSSKCFDNKGEHKPGGGFHQYVKWRTNMNQKFQFLQYHGTEWWYIVNAKSNLAVDSNGNKENGSVYLSYPIIDGNPNQLFKFVYDDDGFYYIINQASGLAMNLENGNTKDWAKIEQLNWMKGNTNQLWKFEIWK